MAQQQQYNQQPTEYDSLLADRSASPSSSSRGSSHGSARSGGGASSSQQGGASLGQQQHHLSTVFEDVHKSYSNLHRVSTMNNNNWTDQVRNNNNVNEHNPQNAAAASSSSSAASSFYVTKSPNIHTKRGCRLWITFCFIGLLVFLFWGLPLEHVLKSDVSERFAPRYDYIIVGGGPSGIITAVKLARRFPHLSVLLLESGTQSQTQVLQALYNGQPLKGKKSSASTLAAAAPFCPSPMATELNKFDIPLLWSGVASSQSRREVYGMESSAQHLWPVSGELLIGRTLGGGGLLNAMIYIRSLRTDWQRWNITGWSDFDNDILPHYLALERYSAEFRDVPSFYKDSSFSSTSTTNTTVESWRGTKGPMTTMAGGYGSDKVGDLFVQSALQAGIPLSARGFNHIDPARRVGVGMYEYNIRDGTRDSVAQALLARRPLPSNLRIRTGHTVTRVLTDSSSPSRSSSGKTRATGIAFQMSNGEMGQFALTDASAEIILAAGAILTPQLLGQSNIGPGGKVLDLPGVGANCNDHPVVALSYEVSPYLARDPPSIYTIGDELEDYTLATAELKHTPVNDTATNDTATSFRLDIMGRLGSLGTAGFSAGAFLRSPWARKGDPSPDIQLTVFPRVIEPHVTRERKRQNINFLHSSVMLVTVALLDADARYVVKASVSDDPPISGRDWVEFEAPRLDLPQGNTSYLSPRDVQRLAWGIQEVRKIMEQPPLANQTENEVIPGASVRGKDLDNFIITSVLPNAHWAGTTRMGEADDPMAVVDETLLVRGTSNVRIVDAGVIPGAPNGNIHSTVSVVASRAADLIAKDRTEALSE